MPDHHPFRPSNGGYSLRGCARREVPLSWWCGHLWGHEKSGCAVGAVPPSWFRRRSCRICRARPWVSNPCLVLHNGCRSCRIGMDHEWLTLPLLPHPTPTHPPRHAHRHATHPGPPPPPHPHTKNTSPTPHTTHATHPYPPNPETTKNTRGTLPSTTPNTHHHPHQEPHTPPTDRNRSTIPAPARPITSCPRAHNPEAPSTSHTLHQNTPLHVRTQPQKRTHRTPLPHLHQTPQPQVQHPTPRAHRTLRTPRPHRQQSTLLPHTETTSTTKDTPQGSHDTDLTDTDTGIPTHPPAGPRRTGNAWTQARRVDHHARTAHRTPQKGRPSTRGTTIATCRSTPRGSSPRDEGPHLQHQEPPASSTATTTGPSTPQAPTINACYYLHLEPLWLPGEGFEHTARSLRPPGVTPVTVTPVTLHALTHLSACLSAGMVVDWGRAQS